MLSTLGEIEKWTDKLMPPKVNYGVAVMLKNMDALLPNSNQLRLVLRNLGQKAE